MSVYIGGAMIAKNTIPSLQSDEVLEASSNLPIHISWGGDEIDATFFRDQLGEDRDICVFSISDSDAENDATGLMCECNDSLSHVITSVQLEELLAAASEGRISEIDLGATYYQAAKTTTIGRFLERLFGNPRETIGFYIADGGPTSCETHQPPVAFRCLLNMLAIPWHALPDLGVVSDPTKQIETSDTPDRPNGADIGT